MKIDTFVLINILSFFIIRMSATNKMGPLKFDGADRIGNSVIRQIQDGAVKDIALFDLVLNTLDFNCKTCNQIRWENNQIPIAQRILTVSLIKIPNMVFYGIVAISNIGIGASFLFLYFNLHFRRMQSVKLSSPKLNNVAVVGCILVYSSVILSGLNNAVVETNSYFKELCTIKVYLLSAGFSLTFGSMLAKTYRIHRLFTYLGAGLVKDKLLKDKQLIVLIFVPLMIDALIMALWVMFDPLERQLHNLTLEISSADRGVVYQPQEEVCSSQNTVGWYIALFGYKSIILIMGVFVAWKTRRIKVPALNDSQYIGICVYCAVFSTVIVIISSLISDYVVFTYLARTSSILTSTTLTLFLLFLPKLRSAYGKIECQDLITQSMGLKTESNTRRFIFEDPKEVIYRLEIQNKVYKCELATLDREIARLEVLLQCSSTNFSRKSSTTVYETTVDCYFLNVPPPLTYTRSSWPINRDHLKITKNVFLSENKLNNDHLFEKMKLFGKLKRYFVSLTTLHSSFQQVEQNLFRNIDEIKPSSSPEVYPRLLEPLEIKLIKAKSDLNIRTPII